jgi:hypothetical protein
VWRFERVVQLCACLRVQLSGRDRRTGPKVEVDEERESVRLLKQHF